MLVVIGGPTAGGKTGLAVRLAQAMAGNGQTAEIVNADSMQVYRDLKIMTARPNRAEQQGIAHHLFGVLPATEKCSAARWAAMAGEAVGAILGRGNLPIVVGGTGLYLRSFLDGLSPMPEIPPAVIAEGEALIETGGAEQLYARLQKDDPVMAARLAPGDRQRVLRAWSVMKATSRSLADWQKTPPTGGIAQGKDAIPLCRVVIEPPRPVLYARCNRRFLEMLAHGGLEEVDALRRRGLSPKLPAMKALGVPALVDYLDGRLDLRAAISKAQTGTRRFAKRQVTWFRNQFPDWRFIEAEDGAAALSGLLALLPSVTAI